VAFSFLQEELYLASSPLFRHRHLRTGPARKYILEESGMLSLALRLLLDGREVRTATACPAGDRVPWPWRRNMRCRCTALPELAGWAEPGILPQGLRVRDGDIGVPGGGHGGGRWLRALRLGRVCAHPR
jgi:transposase